MTILYLYILTIFFLFLCQFDKYLYFCTNKTLNRIYMKFIAVIPARYASTRFPGKPLAILGGKTVIERVYEQVKKVIDDVYVATDDERIRKAVEDCGTQLPQDEAANICIEPEIPHYPASKKCQIAILRQEFPYPWPHALRLYGCPAYILQFDSSNPAPWHISFPSCHYFPLYSRKKRISISNILKQ